MGLKNDLSSGVAVAVVVCVFCIFFYIFHFRHQLFCPLKLDSNLPDIFDRYIDRVVAKGEFFKEHHHKKLNLQLLQKRNDGNFC